MLFYSQLLTSLGTGKSFISALIAKALYKHTSEIILVLSYTNHILDQFLKDLLDNGIPSEDIVRIGSKSTSRTAPLNLFKRQKSSTFNKSRNRWEIVNNLESLVENYRNKLSIELRSYSRTGVS